MPVLFYSSTDPAGTNAAKALKENFGFEKQTSFAQVDFGLWKKKDLALVELRTPLLQAEFLNNYFESDLFVFLSKHKSESAKPCFTTHPSGNFGKAEMGGNDGELCLTSARALKTAFDFIKDKELPAFREATHHGPTSLKTPAIFIEVGSSETEWQNEKYCTTLAEAGLFVCENYLKADAEPAIGFGGTHYCTAFAQSQYAISHVASKHNLDLIDANMIVQMLAKTIEKTGIALLDWNGCPASKRKGLIVACKQNNLIVERV